MIRILKYGEIPNSALFERNIQTADVSAAVAEIIANVRANGDAALYAYSEKFDRVKLDSLVVSDDEMNEAAEKVGSDFVALLERAAKNIRAFHSRQVRNSFILNDKPGVVMGQKVMPIARVGLYVPGGTAAYPSSVLMNAIPAKIAGCGLVIMMTPPGKDGKVNPYILTAAKVAGIDKIYKVGGAQGIAAMAYGTETVPRVDKITGPGNAFVGEAKKQVYGTVAIDMIAGPSEILVVADKTANPRHVAADMLSQAEHDKNATAVLVTDDETLAKNVQAEIEIQLKKLEREAIARVSVDENGKIIVADTLKKAIDIANEIAPEHLELCVDSPFDWLDSVKNAGSIFLGKNCPEALGDYFAGPNHVLPTYGTARFSSPLSVDDFVKKTQYTYFTAEALNEVAEDVATFARAEGLTAHAKSATIRSEE